MIILYYYLSLAAMFVYQVEPVQYRISIGIVLYHIWE